MKMQLPSIDRNQNARPSGGELASAGANKIIPVAPVNPPVPTEVSAVAEPGVIDKVNPALKPQPNQPVYAQPADAQAEVKTDPTAPQDWAIERPEPEKVEDPPPKPMSQMLMEHVRSMWNASASAVQVEQVRDQLEVPRSQGLNLHQATSAQEMLVYTPSKVRKNEEL